MKIFSIEEVAIEVLEYSISYVELIGTLFGFISVYLASRGNILTWAAGIVNELFLFLLFFQLQLYPDMMLQLFFFVTTLYGWYQWGQKVNPLGITKLNLRKRLIVGATIIIGTLVSGLLFSCIHLILPQLFKLSAAYPFADSFVMVSSIAATILLIKKKLDNWFLWIAIDIVCVFIYLKKGIYFLSLEYFIFLGLAIYGMIHWRKRLTHG
jgi:nicotinamide mononucleotide transporter